MESRHFVEGFNFTSKGRDVIDAMLVILLMEPIYDWSFEHPRSLLHEVIILNGKDYRDRDVIVGQLIPQVGDSYKDVTSCCLDSSILHGLCELTHARDVSTDCYALWYGLSRHLTSPCNVTSRATCICIIYFDV